MTTLPKRLLLVGAAPFALAAVYGGSIAFAQSSEPTPSTGSGTTQQEDTTPATPTTPEHAPRNGMSAEDCPNMGGPGSGSSTGGSGTSDSGSTTQTRTRPARGSQQPATVAY